MISEDSVLEKITHNLHDAFQSLLFAGLWVAIPGRMRKMPANQNFHTPEPGPSLLEMYEERCLQAVVVLRRATAPDPRDERYSELVDKADPSVGIMEDHREITEDGIQQFWRDAEAYGKLRGEAETWCGSVAIMRNPYNPNKREVAEEMTVAADRMIYEADKVLEPSDG